MQMFGYLQKLYRNASLFAPFPHSPRQAILRNKFQIEHFTYYSLLLLVWVYKGRLLCCVFVLCLLNYTPHKRSYI